MNRLKLSILSILSTLTLGVVVFGTPKDAVNVFAYSNTTPETYYRNINKYSSGTDLLEDLQSLNSEKLLSPVGYNSMMTYFKQTDPGNYSGQVTSFYSGKSASTSACNREHVWPNSHGGNAVEDDIHMVRPTLKSENEGRGNSFYVEGMNDQYDGWDPANCWNEAYRGDAARIIFYCVVAEPRFELLDVNKHHTTSEDNDYKMGKLSDLLKWNLQYPVHSREITRNTVAEKLQGNRNPFIDHPEYACRIWGNTNSETKKICGSYGIEGDVSISNTQIVDDEITMEVNDNLTFTPSFTGSATPTYSWSFSTQAGTQQQTDVASMTSGSNNSISVKALKVGTTYLKLSATYTMTTGESESLWKAIKINVVPNVEVVSIQITSFPNKISYIVGETFSSYGLAVSANYSDGSSKDVTNSVTLLNTNLDSEGTKTITVSYTYKETTVETSFSVFVRNSSGGGGDTPPASSGGCGGNIATTSVILSSLSLVAAFLITVSIRKKKKK